MNLLKTKDDLKYFGLLEFMNENWCYQRNDSKIEKKIEKIKKSLQQVHLMKLYYTIEK